MKEYSISWLPTVKDSSLAKRMVKEYGDSVEDMVDKWVVMVKPYERAKFNFFYMKRHELAEVTQKLDEKDYGWD